MLPRALCRALATQWEAGHRGLLQLCCDQRGTLAGATLLGLICFLSLRETPPALNTRQETVSGSRLAH